jgi:hypothetical protein
VWPAFRAAAETGDFSAIPAGPRAVAFAWVMSGLVGNGGFSAWVESMGNRTGQLKEALSYLGADEHVAVLDDALAFYPSFDADTEDDRLSGGEDWSEADESRLDTVHAAFVALEERRGLVEHYAAAYLADHPDEFRSIS